MLTSGNFVNSSVRLVRPLGAGGMGEVWLAEHVGLQSPVVVKFMSTALAGDPASVERFSREASSASQVRSPHVVQMLDHGITQGSIPYIVMEYLEGRDLRDHLAERGQLSLIEAVQIVSQVAKALTRAHSLGVIHRDIKPENIFLCGEPGGRDEAGGDEEHFVKLLDFGIAKASNVAAGVTQTGTVLGSPLYMSPEQLIGSRTIDHRSDLWSLAVVTFEAVTGRLPCEGENLGEMALLVHSGVRAVASTLVRELPLEFDEWFTKACALKPDDRFASAKELVAGLEQVARVPLRVAATGHHLTKAQETPRHIAPSIATIVNPPHPGNIADPTLVSGAGQDPLRTPPMPLIVQRPSSPVAAAKFTTGDPTSSDRVFPAKEATRIPRRVIIATALTAFPLVAAAIGVGVWTISSGEPTGGTAGSQEPHRSPASASSSPSHKASHDDTLVDQDGKRDELTFVPGPPVSALAAPSNGTPPADSKDSPNTAPRDAIKSAEPTSTAGSRSRTSTPSPQPPATRPAAPTTDKPSSSPSPAPSTSTPAVKQTPPPRKYDAPIF